MNYTGQIFLIIGLARSGIAAAGLLKRNGATVVGVDDAKIENVSDSIYADFDDIITGPNWRQELTVSPDEIVISPGVTLNHQYLIDIDIPVIGEIELASRFFPGKIIAITGTNGKTTTTELTAHLLRSEGIDARAMGNTGKPFSLYADSMSEKSIAVIEISSFQIESLSTFTPDISMILNLAPDHLDRYDSLEQYYSVKKRLFAALDDDGIAVTWSECHQAREWETDTTLLFGDKSQGSFCWIEDCKLFCNPEAPKLIIPIDEISISGAPNMLNVMAAVTAVVNISETHNNLDVGLRTFKPLNYRQQIVGSINGITFVNDTKATNVHSVCSGLAGYEEKVVLIAGGSGKGEDYSQIAAYAEVLESVILIGDEAFNIASAIQSKIECHHASSMADAVQKAFSLLSDSGTVLLSPACASFDMFDDYAHRGRAFTEAFVLLKNGIES